jgi:acid phosphatase
MAHGYSGAKESLSEGIGPPIGCEVEQVHMVSRHTERYPTKKVDSRMLSLIARLQNPEITTTGDLAFVKD